MRYQVPQLAACPPGHFAPALGKYNAYGAPVVLHDDGVAGGIFSRGPTLGGLGATDAEVQSWINSAGSWVERTAREAWAKLNPGKTPPGQPPAPSADPAKAYKYLKSGVSVNGGPTLPPPPPGMEYTKEGVLIADPRYKAPASAGIYGIPVPVAAIGVGAGLWYLWSRRR